MKTLTVHIEWDSGGEDVEVELDGSETPEEIEQIALETFHSVCNYGYSIDGEPQ